MKKKRLKRLNLSSDSLRILSRDDLGAAAAGCDTTSFTTEIPADAVSIRVACR